MSKESQEKVENERRLDRAYEMTLAGKSTGEISADLGVDERAISHALKERQEAMGGGGNEVERRQTLQLARIQKLMEVQWLQAAEGDATPQAARIFLQLMEREEKLLDQDEARRTQHNGPDGEPEVAAKKLNYRALTAQELRQFLALIAKLQGKDDAESSGAVASA
ncbi:MAG: hypothetical protein OXI80_09155 [Caldilineaceae bacterium]|nr:hypothetical protein [Caldilineaceae bacterium]MDE0337825.1 hypothetical protein [Caldilineaceae bacterium]